MVAIPAYNEADTIADVVRAAQPHADVMIVIDDGSSDDTVTRAKDAGAEGIDPETNAGTVPLYRRRFASPIRLRLNVTPWGIRLVPIMLAVSGFTLVMTGVAAIRCRGLLAEERLTVPYREWLATGRAELFQPDTRTNGMVNVLLVVRLLVAVRSVGYAVAVPKQGELLSEFYLLTEGSDGELVADGYPTEFTGGELRPLYVGIGKQKHERVAYTVILRYRTCG